MKKIYICVVTVLLLSISLNSFGKEKNIPLPAIDEIKEWFGPYDD